MNYTKIIKENEKEQEIQTIRIYRSNIGMECGILKSAMLITWMYMNYIKMLKENEKELETMMKKIRIYRSNIEMECGILKSAMLIK